MDEVEKEVHRAREKVERYAEAASIGKIILRYSVLKCAGLHVISTTPRQKTRPSRFKDIKLKRQEAQSQGLRPEPSSLRRPSNPSPEGRRLWRSRGSPERRRESCSRGR